MKDLKERLENFLVFTGETFSTAWQKIKKTSWTVKGNLVVIVLNFFMINFYFAVGRPSLAIPFVGWLIFALIWILIDIKFFHKH